MYPKKPLVIGHRGAAGHQTENTIPSVQAAIDLGADMIEIDVHAVAGELYAFHDRRLERLTGIEGKFSRLSIESLKQLRVHGHQIPSLKEILRVVSGRATLNIELKGHGCAPLVIEAFSQYADCGFVPENVLVSSFDHCQLHEIKSAEPRANIGVLMQCRPFDLARTAKRLRAYSIHSELTYVTPDFVRDSHKRGLKFFVYTVNHEDDVYDLLEMGVDGIFSDYPDMLRRAIDGVDKNWVA